MKPTRITTRRIDAAGIESGRLLRTVLLGKLLRLDPTLRDVRLDALLGAAWIHRRGWKFRRWRRRRAETNGDGS